MLSSLLTSLRWQDAADIAVSSFILFRLYILFRGTNVFRVIAGLVLLWVFQRISLALGFIVTSWALRGIIAAAALIIIIVFRNEIRSVLQTKNLKSMVWGFPLKNGRTPSEAIADALFDLARQRIGALLVFKNKEDLADVVQPGIRWDGLVSKEMILTIFGHENPVHDGAAVIDGDRITQVGAILPLSQRKDLPADFGTRHRAAAGLTETTDALAVVVSEERGRITLAKGGEMLDITAHGQLIQLMDEHLDQTPQFSRSRNRTKIEISLAAALSILFVSGMWFSFSRGMETLVTLEVPVEYLNRNPQMEIFETAVSRSRVFLTGSAPLIKSLRTEQIKVKIDLADATLGVNIYNISEKNVSLPPGVSLERVDPPAVEVVVDIPVVKSLPVQVDWAGKLPEGVRLYEARLIPDIVQVVGGSQVLKKMTTLYTEPVRLEMIKTSGSLSAELALDPAGLRVTGDTAEKILIHCRVERANS